MKITVSNGLITARAETMQDMKTLLALATPVKTERTRTGKQVGAKSRSKTCKDCGRTYKYLGNHTKKYHAYGAPVAIQRTQAANEVA
jgi:hypothetical protein